MAFFFFFVLSIARKCHLCRLYLSNESFKLLQMRRFYLLFEYAGFNEMSRTQLVPHTFFDHFLIDTSIEWFRASVHIRYQLPFKESSFCWGFCPVESALFLFRNALGWRSRVHEQLCHKTEVRGAFLSRNVNIYALAGGGQSHVWGNLLEPCAEWELCLWWS